MSIDAREFLETLRDCGHRIVWSTDIDREWNRHFTEFSTDWYTTMTNSGKVLDLRNVNVRDEGLRNEIHKFAPDIHIYKIMRKDIHLLEAALKSDKIVASKDKKAQRHFGIVCQHIGEIRDVVWVNPDNEEEMCIDWLKDGAPAEQHRQLGFQVER